MRDTRTKAVSEQTWRQLRAMEAKSRRNRNWRVALVVVVLAVVYAIAARYYLWLSR